MVSTGVSERAIGLRFLESYDGTFFEESRTVEESESLALTESILSMMFGEAVLVPESYATDSLGFLRAFDVIRGSRPGGADRRVNPLYEPFRLGRFRFNNSLRALIQRLRETAVDGDPLRRLHLSGFISITDSPDQRLRLADLLEPALADPSLLGRSFRRARKSFRDDPRVVEILYLIEGFLAVESRLDDVAGDQGTGISSGDLMLGAVGIPLDQIADLDPQRAEIAEALDRGLRDLKQQDFPFSTRSRLILESPRLVERGTISEDVQTGLLALSRVAWSTNLAREHGCTTDIMTTGLRASLPAEVGSELGGTAAALLDKDDERTNLPATSPVHFRIHMDSGLGALIGGVSRNLDEVWMMLEEPEFWESATKLREVLAGRDVSAEPKAAFAAHAGYLGERLGELVSTPPDGAIGFNPKTVGQVAGGVAAAVTYYVNQPLDAASAAETLLRSLEVAGAYGFGSSAAWMTAEKAAARRASRGFAQALIGGVRWQHE
jgi:hypothetical protein